MEKLKQKIRKLEKTLEYLYWRWQDEHKYENIKDYETFLEKKFESVKINSRNFKITIKEGGYTAIINFNDKKSQMSYTFS